MKKKWWIVLVVVILLIIGGGIAWYFVYENNLPGCKKEYRECVKKHHMGYDNICVPCGYIEGTN